MLPEAKQAVWIAVSAQVSENRAGDVRREFRSARSQPASYCVYRADGDHIKPTFPRWPVDPATMAEE